MIFEVVPIDYKKQLQWHWHTFFETISLDRLSTL